MQPAGLLTLTRWLSPAFPTGGFAFSHGLEALVAAGRMKDARDLEDWLADILAHGSGRNDAILLAASWRAETDDARAELADLALALAAGAERAAETCAQGAAFAAALKGSGEVALPDWPLPVAVGAAARRAGLPLAETLLLYLQNFATNLATIAVRHVPLGQSEGQAVLAALAPLIERRAAEAATLGLDDLGGCALAADMASLEHETMQTRIFRS
ncbi:MAG: urease accessory protein UreF [Marinibacterium sp.]